MQNIYGSLQVSSAWSYCLLLLDNGSEELWSSPVFNPYKVMRSGVICSLKSSVNHCWLCGSEAAKGRAGRPLVHSSAGTRAPVLQRAAAVTGDAGGVWAGAHGVALSAPRPFVCAQWSVRVAQRIPCASEYLWGKCSCSSKALQGRREGGGKEDSALAHDYELCSVYLADQTAEDFDLQCSFSLGDALSDTRNKRGLSS